VNFYTFSAGLRWLKLQKVPIFQVFLMQFTLFKELHFVTLLKSTTNTGTLVIEDNTKLSPFPAWTNIFAWH